MTKLNKEIASKNLCNPDLCCTSAVQNNGADQNSTPKNWQVNAGLQVIIAIDGTGYYQEKDQPVRFIDNGDVIFILPNVIHWLSAGADSSLTNVTIAGEYRNELVTWLQKK